MNIKQAKQIPVENLVTSLGGTQAHVKGDDVWFYSPFRPNEKTPSFKVNLKINTWYDFGNGQGGSILDLWLDYHNMNRQDGNAIKSALQGLSPFAKDIPILTAKRASRINLEANNANQREQRFTLIKKPTRIWMDSLKQEQARRGISIPVGNKYLKQAYFKDSTTDKSFNGFAFANDQQGYEISVPNPSKGISFKTVIGQKAPTTISNPDSDTVLIFEGFWDYLSFLEMCGKIELEHQVIILHSLSFIREASENIIKKKDNIKKVFLFQDNDDAGEKALALMAEILEPEGFTIGTMNYLYHEKKDLNDFWRESHGKGKLFKKLPEPEIYAAGYWAEQERTKVLRSNKLN